MEKKEKKMVNSAHIKFTSFIVNLYCKLMWPTFTISVC